MFYLRWICVKIHRILECKFVFCEFIYLIQLCCVECWMNGLCWVYKSMWKRMWSWLMGKHLSNQNEHDCHQLKRARKQANRQSFTSASVENNKINKMIVSLLFRAFRCFLMFVMLFFNGKPYGEAIQHNGTNWASSGSAFSLLILPKDFFIVLKILEIQSRNWANLLDSEIIYYNPKW